MEIQQQKQRQMEIQLVTFMARFPPTPPPDEFGTSFLGSIEEYMEAHTGIYIFEYVEKYINEIGPQHVVQVVTDNATNNMTAAELLKVKQPHVFWTSCATHTINLMLEAIGKLSKFSGVLEKTKALTIFIYAHHRTLAIMRKYTKKRDIVRPGVTRFATSFLTLESLKGKKDQLRLMFTSDEWSKTKLRTTLKGKAAEATVTSISFWNGVSLALNVFTPLVKVLRLVDGDKKPSMAFLFGALEQAKEEVKKNFKKEENAIPILKIVDTKSKGRLDSPLHYTTYLLNPFFYFKDSSIHNDANVMNEFLNCVDKVFSTDTNMQSIISNVELLNYKNKSGNFSRKMAIAAYEKVDVYHDFDPVGWWSNYGGDTPNLQRMAMRFLSLTSSSSGCERNWSQFEGLVEGGDEDQVEPGSGLTWKMVAEASGADEVLRPRRVKGESLLENLTRI
ncbi:uncharacterized protein LOC124930481 [Impatiens glandulifera]|uniref:uncharacterized protein LOC124930481 n=1 Tax=Impatiens glandulifera TaxID=253017 RepID=UPI001FB0B4A5|nr:uncharacterized protein LOC124930481 [Impatiens glandulifera]